MDLSLLMEYGWVLVVLVALEGLLAADNALVLAIMVKHLPEEERKKRYFMGLPARLFSGSHRYLQSRFLLMYGRFRQSVRFICYLWQLIIFSVKF